MAQKNDSHVKMLEYTAKQHSILRYNTLPSLKHDDAPEGMVKRLSLPLVLIVLSVFLYVFAHTKS